MKKMNLKIYTSAIDTLESTTTLSFATHKVSSTSHSPRRGRATNLRVCPYLPQDPEPDAPDSCAEHSPSGQSWSIAHACSCGREAAPSYSIDRETLLHHNSRKHSGFFAGRRTWRIWFVVRLRSVWCQDCVLVVVCSIEVVLSLVDNW